MADNYVRVYQELLARRSGDDVLPMARALTVRPGRSNGRKSAFSLAISGHPRRG
jgi:hypothetical protein